MSSLDRFRSRFGAEFAGQIVAVVSGAVLTVGLARLLGPDEYGLLFFAIAVFGTLGLAGKLGIAKSGARYVAEYKETDRSQLPHVLRVSFLLGVVAASVVATALFVGHRELAAVLGEPRLEPFLLLGVGYLVGEALTTYVRLILQGFERIELSASLHALDRGLRLVFALGFVLLGFGAVGALVGYVLSYAIAAGIGLAVLYRRFYRTEAAPSIEEGLVGRIARYTVPLTATGTANVLDKRIDTVLVGLVLSPVAVSYYVVSKQIVQFVKTPVTALGFTLSPTFGARKASGDVDRAARIYERALVTSLWLYVPIGAGIVLTAGPAVSLVFGGDYRGAVPVLQVLAAYVVLQSVTAITSNGLDYLGRAKSRAIVKGISAVGNVALTVALLPVFGVVGAAIATVITYSAYTAANVYIAHQEFGLRGRYLAGRLSRIVAVAGAMALVVGGVVGGVDGPVSLVLVVALGGVVWAVLSLAAGLVTVDELRSVVPRGGAS